MGIPRWVLNLAGAGESLADAVEVSLQKAKENRGAPPTGSYHNGDFVLGTATIAREKIGEGFTHVLTRGKEARGENQIAAYRFGDFSRGAIHCAKDSVHIRDTSKGYQCQCCCFRCRP